MENTSLTLGITKIGDLLLHQKISQTNKDKGKGNSCLENIKLHIPDYQRPYKWTVKHSNQLLDDIEEARQTNKEVYRVGTLILYHKKREDGTFDKEEGKDIYEIVDGQQRIITFSLLLLSLSNENKNIDFLTEKPSYNSHTQRNIQYNYREFKKRISILKETDKKNLYTYVTTNCELVVVITDELSEAFQFFDSQNSRGKALYPHDLLKAYHLREMNSLDTSEVECVVRTWEELDQKFLAKLFNEYLYRLKEWIKGNRPEDELTADHIDMFKGITANAGYPFAQYYKGAFAYANEFNHSSVPFVAGMQRMRPFQIDAPIIAGKPFFEYAKHYYDILKDIQNNDKYEGYYIKDNPIVKTLDLKKYKDGTGNNITRSIFDTAILLYVDRFCPTRPSKLDTEYLEKFVVSSFIWAYSLRAQYASLGWQSAHNYILETNKEKKINEFNLYKTITEADSPNALLNTLANNLSPIKGSEILHYNNDFAKKITIAFNLYKIFKAPISQNVLFTSALSTRNNYSNNNYYSNNKIRASSTSNNIDIFNIDNIKKAYYPNNDDPSKVVIDDENIIIDGVFQNYLYLFLEHDYLEVTP